MHVSAIMPIATVFVILQMVIDIQKTSANIQGLKKSRFNIEVSNLGSIIIYNSYSAMMIRLDELECCWWSSGQYHHFDSNNLQWLIDNHFLVSEQINEVDDLLNEVESYRKKRSSPYFRILTTYDCNANCYYCFERKNKQTYMSMDVAKKVVQFIQKQITDEKSINIGWFGGEPLLNATAINTITCDLLEKYPDKTIISDITTNGSLIANHIDNFEKWGVKKVQITIDGLRSVYNFIKQYDDPLIDYDLIVQNIQLLIDKDINVSVRINYNNDNVSDVINLIDELYEIFGNKIDLYCSPIYYVGANVGKKDYDANVESVLLYRCWQYGYYRPSHTLKRRHVTCGFSSFDNHFIINPDGSLCKCVESMFDSSISLIGNIDEGITEYETLSKWTSRIDTPECLSCNLLPMCLGNCKLALMNKNSIHCFRYRSQIENIIRKMTKDYIRS